jgi:hypothetical protein
MMLDSQTITLVLSLVAMSAGGVWQLSRVEAALRKDITRSRDEIEAKQDQQVRHFAENLAALRQRLHEVELWTANTFLRRDSFYKAQEELKAEMKALGDKIEARLERMEEKIDRKA